ncbi:8653_t:CDS:2 [Ambispora leptoticha]|uniref:8653_t:CDS:1 n=1 Tax=Ambispora leptoticha TaxID=144679 RepID=A0A9N9A043_9GLOM|nr:8653_t:CDS:2 [Ambispora leptoticha]
MKIIIKTLLTTDILGHVYNKIYGNWVCWASECCYKEWCDNEWPDDEWPDKKPTFTEWLRKKWRQGKKTKYIEWQKGYTTNELENFLEKTSEEMTVFFDEPCKKCHDSETISSFRLYLPFTLTTNEKPDLEIIVHLVWKNFYRVFGYWKCSNCDKTWCSAYTWISLEKYIYQIEGKELEANRDFCSQECKRCKRYSESEMEGYITRYEPLEYSEDGSVHKERLCAKCQSGSHCHLTGDYFGY